MSYARETALTVYVMYFISAKLKSCAGYNSNTAREHLIIFGRTYTRSKWTVT